MIDIHCHALPKRDDGAQDMVDSLEILRSAYRSGVSELIVTPHCIPAMFENYNGKTLDSAFDELFSAAEEYHIGLKLHKGMEVFAVNDLPRLYDSGLLLTLAGSDYMLIEWEFSDSPERVLRVVNKLLERGLKLVIAHPERYYFVQDDIRYALDLVNMGCALQLNKDSILGAFGRKCMLTAEELLMCGAAQLVASDAHGSFARTADMQQVYDRIAVRYSLECADLLLKENPKRIIENRRLVFPEIPKRDRFNNDEFISDEEFWGI